jgi:adenylate cyclase class 2
VHTSASQREVEIKLRVPSAPSARHLLRRAGFRVLRRRVLEDNAVLDTPGLALRRSGAVLRIRKAGRRATLTCKGQATPGKYKSRQEIELEISSAPAALLAFEKLGFKRAFRYQKYRTEYTRPGARGVVMLDETPIGCFLEIEGKPVWIDWTARNLGFAEADYITASYGGLYLEFCKARGIRPGDMVFASEMPL